MAEFSVTQCCVALSTAVSELIRSSQGFDRRHQLSKHPEVRGYQQYHSSIEIRLGRCCCCTPQMGGRKTLATCEYVEFTPKMPFGFKKQAQAQGKTICVIALLSRASVGRGTVFRSRARRRAKVTPSTRCILRKPWVLATVRHTQFPSTNVT